MSILELDRTEAHLDLEKAEDESESKRIEKSEEVEIVEQMFEETETKTEIEVETKIHSTFKTDIEISLSDSRSKESESEITVTTMESESESSSGTQEAQSVVREPEQTKSIEVTHATELVAKLEGSLDRRAPLWRPPSVEDESMQDFLMYVVASILFIRFLAWLLSLISCFWYCLLYCVHQSQW